MRPIDSEPIIRNLSAMKTQLGYDAIAIDGIIKALREAEEVVAVPQPNDPLTLEELREMDGEPVWVERNDGAQSRWAIVGDFESLYGVYFGTAQGGLRLPYDEYGETWIAYRRKPEKGAYDVV